MDELVLASGSPRRAELLTQLGVFFRVVAPHIDESVRSGEQAHAYVTRMSTSKMAETMGRLPQLEIPILCADTIVVLDGEILGKPVDEADATRMLMSMSGRDHQVLTAVTLGRGDHIETFVTETLVTFRHLTYQDCRSYWLTGEPRDKAGAYGAQGLGAIFIESIVGSHSNVVGLPISPTAERLRHFGIDCLKMSAARRKTE